jgi:purine-binding chemotaxis protein CheW
MSSQNDVPSLSLLQGDDENNLTDKYLTFHLDEEYYGIHIKDITEIIGMHAITDVPGTSSHIKGVINLRGNVIPVLDVRIRFEMPERNYDERTCIIVVNYEETAVGLIVDSVNEVLDISPKNIEAAPKMGSRSDSFIVGIAKVAGQVKILLDIHKLLFDENFNAMDELISS